MQEFIEENLSLVILVVVAFLNIILGKTNTKKLIKGAFEMVYKTEQTQKTAVSSAQTFDKMVPVYRKNKVSGELEFTGDYIDVQEYVNSFKSTSFESMLDTFLPPDIQTENSVLEAQNNFLLDKLDLFTHAHEQAQEIRLKYNLSEDLTTDEIFAYVKEKHGLVSDRIKELEKEALENEKKNSSIEESKQA